MKSLSWKSERGTSLVEILVVMVVLVVGIFTVIRIFPVGFDILQFTGDSSVAHRLSESEAEFWRRNAENMPDGIVAILPGSNGVVADPTARPNDFISGTGAFGDNDPGLQSLIATRLQQAGYTPSAEEIDRWVGPNRARRIIGETTRIPVPSVTSAGETGSVYSLAYAPIEWSSKNVTDPNEAEQYLQVRGNALSPVDFTGIPKDSLSAAVSNLRSRQYGIDYANGVVYFPPSDRLHLFVATYSYNTAGGIQTVLSDPIVVQPTRRNIALSNTGVLLGVARSGSGVFDGAFKGIAPGTDSVSPKFRYVPANQPFSTDPYEYKMLSRYALGAQFTGGLVFNPRGYNMTETGPGGSTIPLQAKIDYTVKDWRVLHQDVPLPVSPPKDKSIPLPYRVTLALQFLKQAGVTTAENSLEPWQGLTVNSSASGYSVIAVDLSNGAIALNSLDPNATNSGGIDVDYKAGFLFFPPGKSAGGSGLRVYAPNGAPATVDPAQREGTP